ncbi:MAG: PEP-CTERM sorting domain-containing protein [Anaerohalosphaeraceae bacterium]|nr:PEP-CTERM sorting domain-containing protein [Anaerohalosphaeraceae bacterium]
MSNKWIVSALLLSVFSVVALGSPIDTVTMDRVGYGAKDTMQIWGGGHNGLNVYGGVFMFNKTADTGDGSYFDNGLLGGFCMDLSQYAANDSQTYEMISPEQGPRPTDFLGGPMGSVKANYLSELWARYYDPTWAAGGSYSAQQNQDAGAFAASVWEIIYEDSSANWDVTTDGTSGELGFKATGLNHQTANDWLASLNGTGPMANLFALSHDCKQDFLVVVPEPATVALLSVGFLMLNRKRFACSPK